MSPSDVWASRNASRRDEPRLPLQPLLNVLPIDHRLARPDVLGPGMSAQAAALLNVSPRSIARWRHEGLSPWTADRLAITAGHHPVTVWGWAWVHAIDPTSADDGSQRHAHTSGITPAD